MYRFFSALVFGFVICSCASAPMPERHHFIQTTENVGSNPNQATVYFYRGNQFVGSAVSYYIYDGNERIGALKNNCYFVHSADPGEHFFWSENEKISSVTVECIAGKTYYIEGGVSLGAGMGNPELSLVPEVVASKRMKGIPSYTFDFDRPRPPDPIR